MGRRFFARGSTRSGRVGLTINASSGIPGLGAPMRDRTSRSTSESGRAAQVSRVSQEGQVFGVNHATRGSATPSAVSQRERGMPLTAGVRRPLGLTNGRPGVTSPIWRARTRRTACTPAWTRRARCAEEHRPRSATSTAPACQLGCTACTWATSWVRRGATTRVRSPPVPAWHTPRRCARGTPHPGRCTFGWPNAGCHAGGLGHGAAGTIDQQGARPMPAPFL